MRISKYIWFTLLACSVFFKGFAQLPKLNKQEVIDTLSLSLKMSDKVDGELQLTLLRTFERSVKEFNSRDKLAFYAEITDTQSEHFFEITIDSVRYVSTGLSVGTVLLDLGLIAADIALISNGIPIIIYPFLMPATIAVHELNMSYSVEHPKNKKNELQLNPNGIFCKKETQDYRLNKRFSKQITRLLNKLNRVQKRV